MPRTLLFLSADSFQAYVWKGSKLALQGSFGNDSDGREQFSNLLEGSRNPALLLVDIIEEDFHQETVPHLFGPNRSALLDRKFEQYYRTTPFRQATLLQRQSEGRRDDDMLFSALTNPKRITPWLDALLAKHIPLRGIYSVPIISAPLLKEIASEHVLLLSWEKSSGLRQTYFSHKKLHFSRLIPISEGGSFCKSVYEETPRTQQYLKSRSLPPPGEQLDVHIICHSADRAELHAKLSDNGNLHFTYLDIQDIGKRFGCEHVFDDSDATPLFLDLLAASKLGANYANSSHTHFYLTWQLKRAFYGLAIITLLASLAWSGLSYWMSNVLVAGTEPVKMQTAQLNQQTAQIQSNFGNMTIPAADMKTAVMLARNLNEYTPTPKEVIGGVSRVLDKFQRIALHKLSWQTSPADAAPSPYPAQLITFEGELTGFGNAHRQELDYLNQFQQALFQQGYSVTAETLPLDVSSKGSISGDTKTSTGKAALFTLKIIWRHPS